MKRIQQVILSGLVLMLLSGCGKKDDKSVIMGIWQITSSTVGGGPVGEDGKSWFHFRDDGVVDTRPRPAVYESGKYAIDPEKKELTLSDGQAQLTYNYFLNEDQTKLTLKAFVKEVGQEMVVYCVKVDDFPVTKETDLQEEPIPNFSPGGPGPGGQ